MPKTLPIFQCLLISPGDVNEERDAVEGAVSQWNGQIGAALSARVELVRWETHSRPDMSGAPQDVLNRQIVDNCDFGIAIFWSRLGSPTKTHPSGSAEEVDRILSKNRNVMVYFCSRAIPQGQLLDDQYARLQELKKEFRGRGLLAEFETPADLVTAVTLHLTRIVTEMIPGLKGSSEPIPAVGTVTSPKPDIRVIVEAAVVGGRRPVIEIAVQNHSPSPFFFQSLCLIEEEQLRRVFVPRDAITMQELMPRKVESGDSFKFYIDPMLVFKDTGELSLIGVQVKDKIDRTYNAATGSTKAAMADWRAWHQVMEESGR